MFGLWLQVLALSLSPEFHHWLHGDSHGASHECPVTLLNKGTLLLDTSSGIAISAPISDVSLLVTYAGFSFSSHDYRLSRGRAPPSC